MSKRLDEKTKLLANALNTAATSCFTIGVVGPIVAVSINLGDAAAKVPIPTLALSSVFWLFAAVMLHLGARKVLDGLSE